MKGTQKDPDSIINGGSGEPEIIIKPAPLQERGGGGGEFGFIPWVLIIVLVAYQCGS